MTDVREMLQCGECGALWELEDATPEFDCNCGNNSEWFEKCIFCEECNTCMAYEIEKHTQEDCEGWKRMKYKGPRERQESRISQQEGQDGN